MRPSRSLRSRIVLAYMLLAGLLCFLFCAVAYVSVETIELRVLKEPLLETSGNLIERHLHGERDPHEPEVRTGGQAPAEFRDRPPGVYEANFGGQDYHVLVVDYEGSRYTLLQNVDEYERIKVYVWIALATACLVCLVAAFLFGSATASRVIRPVTVLADAVDEDRLAGLPALQAQDELGVLARAFAARSDEMHRFLVRERLFTGDVSHELRTPLTVILGAAELLQARLQDRPELLAPVERIRRTAVDSAERVNALLMLSRAPESADFPEVQVAAIIEHEAERCRSLLRDKPVTLDVALAAQPTVRGRPELMAIAVANLLRNACQYTERGAVRVTLSDDRVTVEDTGPGIPPELREKLFERFVRGAPESIPGSGLGLAIVRRVCEHLHWQVELQEGSSGGSRFVIRFAPPDAFASSLHSGAAV